MRQVNLSAVSPHTLRVAVLGLNYAPEFTGIAPYTAGLAQGLVSRGHRVQVLTSHPHYPEWRVARGYGGWSRTSTEAGVRITRLAHYVPSVPGSVRRLLSELSFGLRLWTSRWGEADAVVLISPALFSSLLAAVRIRLGLRRPPCVLWIQDLYSLGLKETGAGGAGLTGVVTRIERWVAGSADRVVVIHSIFRDHVVNVLGIPADRVEIVRNWTHLAPVEDVDRAAARARFGWGDRDVVVLHSGNQGVKQGLENVVEAARLAEQQHSDVLFVLMGDGSQRKQLERVGSGCSRLRFVDSLPDWDFQAAMQSADILVVNELPGVAGMAVPSKLTSYFTAGRPVLAATSEASATAGEIRASGGGERVEPGDPAALLNAAESLGRDVTRAEAMGKAGRQFVRSVLDESAALDRFEAILTEMIDAKGGPHS